MKFCLERIREGSHDWGLASGEDHNAALESALHGQKHCWLLHLLYDDLGLKWNEILKINWLWLDFVLYYQYDYDISRIENLSQMKTRLLEIQKELLSRARSIRQKARRRVLKGEMNLFDYELSLRILFYDKEGREGMEIIEDIKFEDPFKIWKGIRGLDKNRIFSSLKYRFEELGFELEKMLTFKELWANLVLKYSDTIVLAKNKQLVGSGTGQTSRVDALKQAIEKARAFKLDLDEAVMASDAFFPFADSVEIADKAGIKAVIQPGGSIRDADSINYCDDHNLAMVFTGRRHFKH